MGRKAGRTPEQTRRLLLNAAATVLRTRGMTATLDDVAREAGVSKGGLIYHFAGKDELVQALATDLIDEFRRAVGEALDPADTGPGRLTRAYIRASLDTAQDDHTLRATMSLTAQLITSPEVEVLMRADADRWTADLGADGLPADVLLLVVAAADGAGAAAVWGSRLDHARLREQLIALTWQRETSPAS